MVQIRRGDIVEVDLGGPHDDDTRGHEIYKRRPAVVIQNDIGNRNAPTTIIAPITGGRSNYPFHVNLPAGTNGLSKDSHAQLDQIRTVDIEQRVIDNIGAVSDQQLSEINSAIEISLGLQ